MRKQPQSKFRVYLSLAGLLLLTAFLVAFALHMEVRIG